MIAARADAGRIARRAWFACVLLLVSASAVHSHAQAVGEPGAGQATVRLDGQPLFRVTESGETAAGARARQIEQRLAAVLESTAGSVAPAARLQAAPDQPGELLVIVAGRTLVRVTPADAEERGTTVEALAARWARSIDEGLAAAARSLIGETEGTVERIELRATVVRTYDGRQVSVPNAETFTSRVTNNTASPVRRASVTLPLGYDADLKRACDALLQAARGVEGVLPEPSPTVRLRALEADELLLELRFWTDSRRSDFVATESLVRFALLDRLAQAGIELLPEQVVRLQHGGRGRPRE